MSHALLIRIRLILLFASLTELAACGFDCVDKKTGLHKSSENESQAKDYGVFRYEMACNKHNFELANGREFIINKSWVEDGWLFDCIDNKAVLKKDGFLQLVIDGVNLPKVDSLDYILMENNNSYGAYLGGVLDFKYTPQDTITLILMSEKSKIIIETLKFWKASN